MRIQQNFSYQMMRLLNETVYKWMNHKWNLCNLVPILNETIVKHEIFVNLDAPNNWISRPNDAFALWNRL
jgi:hypothetical protein